MLKLAFGKSEKNNIVENREVPWGELTELLSKKRIRPGSRPYLVCGQCPSGIRGGKHGDKVAQTSLLMLDYDGPEGALDWMDFWLELSSLPYTLAAYTTRSYTGDNIRFRVVVPFATPLDRSKHAAAVRHVVDQLPESWGAWLDGCSMRPDQVFFLSCVMSEDSPFESIDFDGEMFDPAAMGLSEEVEEHAGDMGGLDALDAAVQGAPCDLTDDEVAAYLDALDPSTLSYGGDEGVFGWLDVGMALAHQYQGSDAGFKRWVQWSARCEEKHEERGMRARWNSFDIAPRGRKPLTFASVIKRVRDAGGAMAVVVDDDGNEATLFDRLLEEARGVDSIDSCVALTTKISAMSSAVLPAMSRSMLVSEIYDAFGKGANITKSSIKDDAKIKKRGATAANDRPEWMRGWCYIEKTSEFYYPKTSIALPEKGFNGRYTREPECRQGTKIIDASVLALKFCGMPTVVDRMYWPGAGVLFECNDEKYVNAYSPSGIAPVDTIDAAGQAAIELMLAHFEILISDERERTIVLDWLTFVYQNPGKRVNWALLIQGAQGIGKSYISQMMSNIMGHNTQQLDSRAIKERFTGWAQGTVLTVIEEISVQGESKYEIIDRMKPFITNDTVQIEEKFKGHRTVPNFTSYIAFTNHKDAIPVSDGDRRYCVIYADIQSERALFEKLGGLEGSADYFAELFSQTEAHAGAIARFFKDRQISDAFNPKGRAPETRALATIKRLSVSENDELVEDAINEHWCDVINDKIIDITFLQNLAESMSASKFPKASALRKVLMSLGYEPLNGRVWITKTRKYQSVWIKVGEISPDLARLRVENFHNKEDVAEEDLLKLQKPYDDSEIPF